MNNTDSVKRLDELDILIRKGMRCNGLDLSALMKERRALWDRGLRGSGLLAQRQQLAKAAKDSK